MSGYTYIQYSLCIMIVAFSACLPAREGRVKSIHNGQLKKGDEVFYFNGFHTYATFGNTFTGSAWDPPTPQQKHFEFFMDSIQANMVARFFKVQQLTLPGAAGEYKIRPFVYRERVNKTERIKSDSISWALANFSWSIKDNLKDQTMAWLPDTIKQLSYKHPVLFFTNDHYFWEIEFLAGYAEGTTGMNWRATIMAAAVYKGVVVYFRSYKKSYKFKKAERNSNLIQFITEKVLDKVS